jgi:plastocyanin
MIRITFAALLGCALLVSAHTAFATDAQVTIDNFAFSPAELDVKAGTRVVWLNRDDIPHTVTDATDPRGTKSPPLDTGESYGRVFDKPGTYRYFCSLHPHMQGTVVVR